MLQNLRILRISVLKYTRVDMGGRALSRPFELQEAELNAENEANNEKGPKKNKPKMPAQEPKAKLRHLGPGVQPDIFQWRC